MNDISQHPWRYARGYATIARRYINQRKRLGFGDAPIPRSVFKSVPEIPQRVWDEFDVGPNPSLVAQHQKFFVHDIAEFDRIDGVDGLVCTCGLHLSWSDIGMSSLDRIKRKTTLFAEERDLPIETQLRFFEHPGHRDTYHSTVLGAYFYRLCEPNLSATPYLEARCHTCGAIPGIARNCDSPDQFPAMMLWSPLDAHNMHCPQPGTDFFDGDLYLWGHNPTAWLKAARSEPEPPPGV